MGIGEMQLRRMFSEVLPKLGKRVAANDQDIGAFKLHKKSGSYRIIKVGDNSEVKWITNRLYTHQLYHALDVAMKLHMEDEDGKSN